MGAAVCWQSPAATLKQGFLGEHRSIEGRLPGKPRQPLCYRHKPVPWYWVHADNSPQDCSWCLTR